MNEKNIDFLFKKSRIQKDRKQVFLNDFLKDSADDSFENGFENGFGNGFENGFGNGFGNDCVTDSTSKNVFGNGSTNVFVNGSSKSVNTSHTASYNQNHNSFHSISTLKIVEENKRKEHRDYGRQEQRDYGRQEQRDYGRQEQRDYGRQEQRDYGRQEQRDYGRQEHRDYSRQAQSGNKKSNESSNDSTCHEIEFFQKYGKALKNNGFGVEGQLNHGWTTDNATNNAARNGTRCNTRPTNTLSNTIHVKNVGPDYTINVPNHQILNDQILTYDDKNIDGVHLKLPFSCYRHDISASRIHDKNELHRLMKKPEPFNVKKLHSLLYSISDFKEQLHHLRLTMENLVDSMEDVCDSIPLSNQLQDQGLIENIDFHIQLNQVFVNNCLNWETDIHEKVELPLTMLAESIPIQAAEIISGRRHSIRNSKKALKKNDAMDSVAQDLIPAIMNLLSKQLDSHLDTIDTTNEVIEKIGLPANRKLEQLPSLSQQTFFSSNARSAVTQVTIPNLSRHSDESFLSSPNKEYNIDFLNKLMDNW